MNSGFNCDLVVRSIDINDLVEMTMLMRCPEVSAVEVKLCPAPTALTVL